MIRPMAAADIPAAMQRSTGTRETRRRGGDRERMGWAAGLRGLRARPGARHCIAARRMAARQLASPIVSAPGRSGLGSPRCSVLVLGTLCRARVGGGGGIARRPARPLPRPYVCLGPVFRSRGGARPGRAVGFCTEAQADSNGEIDATGWFRNALGRSNHAVRDRGV